MAGGKEELAAMLHGSGFGLEGFGGGERSQDLGHTDEGRAALFHSVFWRTYTLGFRCFADLLLFSFLAAKILHSSLRLVRGQTALTVSRGTLQHIPESKQMQNSEFRAGAEQRGSETTGGSGPGYSAPPPTVSHHHHQISLTNSVARPHLRSHWWVVSDL